MGHAADLFRSRVPTVFNAVAVVDAWRTPHGCLDGIERHGDGRITLGVNADLPPVAMCPNDQFFQLLRLPVGGASEFTIRSVRLGEPGRAADERAVGVESSPMRRKSSPNGGAMPIASKTARWFESGIRATRSPNTPRVAASR